MEPEILTDHAAQDSLEYDLTNNDRRSFDMLEETKRITKGGGYTGNYWTNILARNHSTRMQGSHGEVYKR